VTRSVDEEPHVRLERWGVMRDSSGYRLVGIHADTQRCRVSSKVVAWDSHARIAETESGRQYHLVGEPNPEIAVQLIWVHTARWGAPRDRVSMAVPEELDEFLETKPGVRLS